MKHVPPIKVNCIKTNSTTPSRDESTISVVVEVHSREESCSLCTGLSLPRISINAFPHSDAEPALLESSDRSAGVVSPPFVVSANFVSWI